MKNRSMEYWYSIVTMLLFTAAIITRPELSVPDKILTIALLSAIPWIACFIRRKELEKEELEKKEKSGQTQVI